MKNNLRKFRKEAGLTLSELAMATDMTSAHLSKIENCKSSLSLIKAYSLATVLHKTVYEIWPDETKFETVSKTMTFRKIIVAQDEKQA